jgi:PAS domain S-box-containing protein
MLEDMLELRAGPMATIVYDYSYWDDIVEFVSEPDSVWAKENIDAAVSAFKLSAIWICRPDMSPVYVAGSLGLNPTPAIPFPASDTATVFENGYFSRFFANLADGIAEIRTAPIQPGDDSERKTEPQGFFIAAVLYDSAYFAGIDKYIGGRLSVSTSGESYEHSKTDHSESLVHVSDTLRSYDGTAVGIVRAMAESNLLRELNRAVSRLTVILIAFAAFISVVVWISLYLWVVRPMRLITHALSAESADAVAPLVTNKTELGHIAHLIGQFFIQKKKLVQEVFDRSLAEEALRENEQRYRFLYNNTPVMLHSIDPQGRLISVSDYWLHSLGYERDEVIGRKCTDFLTADSQRCASDIVLPKFLRTGCCTDVEYQFVKRNGEVIDTLISAIGEKDADGRLVRGLAVVIDITARKLSEEQNKQLMLQLQKAQRTEALAVLAGGVAHDLNNVLGPLVAYPEMMLEQLPAEFVNRRELEIMERSATQAAGIIRDLLTLARRGRYNMQPTDINEVVTTYLESVSFISLTTKNPGVTVHQELASGLPVVAGSESHLTQAIMNLVVNAFDAMPNGGSVTIKTHLLNGGHLTSRGGEVITGDFVIVQVADTGAGIAESDLDKIFEPYYSKKELGQSSGSGLGLSVVHGVVKDNNGFCDVSSTVGRGSVFQVFIPILKAHTEKEIKADAVFGGSESVLIIDDMVEQLRLASALLRSLGYTVATANDGKTAIDMVRHGHYDVCVIDMILQKELDGLETYRRILEENPQQKAVIVSGFAATDRVQEMLRIGAGAYLQKPYRRNDLARAIRQVIDSGATKKVHV